MHFSTFSASKSVKNNQETVRERPRSAQERREAAKSAPRAPRERPGALFHDLGHQKGCPKGPLWRPTNVFLRLFVISRFSVFSFLAVISARGAKQQALTIQPDTPGSGG